MNISVDQDPIVCTVPELLGNVFQPALKEYFLNTQFSSDASDLDLIITFRLVVESISTSGSQTIINAQAILTNKLGQYFYAKGIQFPYFKGYKILHDSIFDPLALLLDYYALMFIAAELDTWEEPFPIERFLEKVTQAYAKVMVVQTAQEQGYTVVSEQKSVDNTIEVVVEKW